MYPKRDRKSQNPCIPEAKKGVDFVRKTKINFWIDSDLHKRLKVFAATGGVTITSIICNGIENYLKKEQNID